MLTYATVAEPLLAMCFSRLYGVVKSILPGLYAVQFVLPVDKLWFIDLQIQQFLYSMWAPLQVQKYY